ncbi:minor tail protein [Mycobacterium phage Benzema]|nr:minor tail protein [Mycobacterium phage Benzema]
MANDVSGLAGYLFYLDDSTAPLNPEPFLPSSGLPYPIRGLDANTDYSNRIYVTAIDNAGNETDPIPLEEALDELSPFPASTLSPTPEQSPMNSTRTTAIDNIIKRCIAAGAGPGVTVGITSPWGYYLGSFGEGTGVDRHFLMGSQTKSFLSWAVMMAIDEGRLSLDTTINDILDTPWSTNPTIQQLMMMRSGMYNYQSDSAFGLQVVMNPAMSYSLQQMIAKSRNGAKQFEPGEKYDYNNGNSFALALMLEETDPEGRKIHEIIKQDILDPLDLVNTNFPTVTSGPPAPSATLYSWNFLLSLIGIKLRQNVTVQNPNITWAAGCMTSVVGDMLKWGKELRDCTLLSPESAELIHTTHIMYPSAPYGLNKDGATEFGYGLHGHIKVGSWRGSDGSWIGCDSATMYEPTTGTIITVYENFQTPGLLSLATVWHECAEYLMPGSATYPGYQTGENAAGTIGTSLKKLGTLSEGAVFAPGTEGVEFDNASAVSTTRDETAAFTIASDAKALVAWVSAQGSTDWGGAAVKAKIDGIEMEKVVSTTDGTTSGNGLVCFRLLNPPTGANKKVTFEGMGSLAHYYANGAVSYKNVGSFGAPVKNRGSGSSASLTVGGTTSLDMVVGGYYFQGAHNSFNKSVRGVKGQAAFVNQGLLFGDSAAGGDVTLTETFTSSISWSGTAFVLRAEEG